MGEITKSIDLKSELDRIDNECLSFAGERYYQSRLRILVGMWEKGKIVYEYRGVNSYSYRDLEEQTGRDKNSIKKWNDVYEKHPNKQKYIAEKAEPESQQWTQKALTEKKENKAHVSHSSGENEWYTPPNIIQSARVVMGTIDLDPATSEKANEVVKASKIFTINNSGLEQEWHGNVWLNPPYAQPLISQFSDKVVEQTNNFSQCMVLVNNATETTWLQNMMARCDAICFVKGRIRFVDVDGNPSGAPLQGQVILYFGKSGDKFNSEFKAHGICTMMTGGK